MHMAFLFSYQSYCCLHIVLHIFIVGRSRKTSLVILIFNFFGFNQVDDPSKDPPSSGSEQEPSTSSAASEAINAEARHTNLLYIRIVFFMALSAVLATYFLWRVPDS